MSKTRGINMKFVKKTLSVLIIGALTFQGASPAFAQKAKSDRAANSGANLQTAAGILTVSNFEFNTFVFNHPVENIFFPAGTPLVGEPIFLSENRQVMLQFAEAKNPIQVVFALANHETVTLRVQPKKVAGITHSVNGASIKPAKKKIEKTDFSERSSFTPDNHDIEILKELLTTNEVPDGFDPIALPNPTRFDKFSVVPLAGWSDGMSKNIYVFSLVAVPGQTAVVTPPQFYRAGITAVLVSSDVVDANNSPNLFIVEELTDE